MSYKAVIVDDEVNIRSVTARFFERVLRSKGIEDVMIEQAGDGACAYDLIKESVPDLVVVDQFMPGLRGSDLCKKLRLDFGDGLYIVGTSGNPLAEDDFYGSGADYFLRKPFLLKDIYSALEQVIRS